MAAAAVGLANTRPPWSARGRVLLSRTAAVVCNFAVGNPNRLPTPSSRRLFLARASEPQKEGEEASTTNEYDIASAFTSQEDLDYLWKLGAGSVVGAAIIKYGSILFPELTRPNIVQALIMILSPVVIAVYLLTKQSRVE